MIAIVLLLNNNRLYQYGNSGDYENPKQYCGQLALVNINYLSLLIQRQYNFQDFFFEVDQLLLYREVSGKFVLPGSMKVIKFCSCVCFLIGQFQFIQLINEHIALQAVISMCQLYFVSRISKYGLQYAPIRKWDTYMYKYNVYHNYLIPNKVISIFVEQSKVLYKNFSFLKQHNQAYSMRMLILLTRIFQFSIVCSCRIT
eukprot:TRINITY_DN33129_c0_g1_i1.p1 TRINITY_DN33129_c0_g1~~TRINITY_DN33129_c0_g1_i1.p1  ORF type:complete len:200 (+),score=-9.31 TRINITY_DN33129_c0_g1_i1:464-1063(+)